MKNSWPILFAIIVGVGLMLTGVVILTQLQPSPTIEVEETPTITPAPPSVADDDVDIIIDDEETDQDTTDSEDTADEEEETDAGSLFTAGDVGGAVCGESCSSDSDCAPATTGADVVCYQGTCQAAECPGSTIFGTRCDCEELNPCGSPCSSAVGLCGAGSACRYINGSGCAANPDVDNPTNTYCIPLNPVGDYSIESCVGRDTQNSYLRSPDGSAITSSVITALCQGRNPLQFTSDELPRTNLSNDQIVLIAGVFTLLVGGYLLIKYSARSSNSNE